MFGRNQAKKIRELEDQLTASRSAQETQAQEITSLQKRLRTAEATNSNLRTQRTKLKTAGQFILDSRIPTKEARRRLEIAVSEAVG